MEDGVVSDGLRLATHVARPPGPSRVPSLVLSHDWPSAPRGGAAAAATLPQLADRIADECGWCVASLNLRGTGASEGDFSLAGWTADLRAAVDFLARRDDVTGVWMVGIGLGGALSICVAATDPRVRGVATMAAPASLAEWTRDPARVLATARALGVVRHHVPTDVVAWARPSPATEPVACARALPPRPLFLLHGSEDETVPVAAARRLAEAGGPSAELRIVQGAGHRLRHDPRAVASLLGWLERQGF